MDKIIDKFSIIFRNKNSRQLEKAIFLLNIIKIILILIEAFSINWGMVNTYNLLLFLVSNFSVIFNFLVNVIIIKNRSKNLINEEFNYIGLALSLFSIILSIISLIIDIIFSFNLFRFNTFKDYLPKFCCILLIIAIIVICFVQIIFWINDFIRIYIKTNHSFEYYMRMKTINTQFNVFNLFKKSSEKYQNVEEIQIFDKNPTETTPINIENHSINVDKNEVNEKVDGKNDNEDNDESKKMKISD